MIILYAYYMKRGIYVVVGCISKYSNSSLSSVIIYDVSRSYSCKSSESSALLLLCCNWDEIENYIWKITTACCEGADINI